MNLFYDPLELYPVFRRRLRPGPDGRLGRFLDLSVRAADTDAKAAAKPVADRIRLTLHTHHGRDKLFKLIQYSLRLLLWSQGIDPNTSFVTGGDATAANFTSAERNLMTITNTRRMFKLGRFVGEFTRVGTTVWRIAALVDLQRRYSPRTLVWLQLQMVLDVVARLMMCVKSVADDVGWASRKGFLHASVEERLQRFSGRLSLPVLTIDLFLNTVRLAQGIVDAAAHRLASDSEGGSTGVVGRTAYSQHGSGSGPFDSSPALWQRRGSAASHNNNNNNRASTPSVASEQSVGRATPPNNNGTFMPQQQQAHVTPAARPRSRGHSRRPSSEGGLGTTQFSLLSTYDELDRMRRVSSATHSTVAGDHQQTPRTTTTGQAARGSPNNASATSATRRPVPKPATAGAITGRSPNTKRESAAVPAAVSFDRAAAMSPPDTTSSPTASTGTAPPPQPPASSLVTADSLAMLPSSAPALNPPSLLEPTAGTEEDAAALRQQEDNDADDAEEEDDERVVVHSVAELLWRDRTLRWITAHQMKLILDLVVASLMVLRVKGAMGITAVCGILSALISVLRVWHFGR